MIQAVSDKQYDFGMTGITINDERKQKVDFSDPYMRSEIFMLVRSDETRFTEPKAFAADEKLLIGAQAGTSPFYVAVYNVLDGNEQNPRIKLFETFAAEVAALQTGDVDLVLTDSAGGKALVAASGGKLKTGRRTAAGGGFRVHLPQGFRPGRADQRRHRGAEGRRHLGQDHPEVVRGLQARAVSAGLHTAVDTAYPVRAAAA